jgi:hypothetical protein
LKPDAASTMTNSTTTQHDPPPIACSLTAAEYRERTAAAGEVARAALRDRQAIDGGARLTFDATADVEHRLIGFVAAESQCCPFLRLELERIDGSLILDVTGPADAAPIIEELFA